MSDGQWVILAIYGVGSVMGALALGLGLIFIGG